VRSKAVIPRKGEIALYCFSASLMQMVMPALILVLTFTLAPLA